MDCIFANAKLSKKVAVDPYGYETPLSHVHSRFIIVLSHSLVMLIYNCVLYLGILLHQYTLAVKMACLAAGIMYNC